MAVTAEGRECRKCGEWKLFEDFHRHPTGPGGRRTRCKSCTAEDEQERHKRDPDVRRWTVIRYKYGLEREDYEALLDAQDHCCAICSRKDVETRNGPWERYPFHIDHDHETGRIRGLLCFRCNNGIGLLGSAELLEAAAEYLKKGVTPSP